MGSPERNVSSAGRFARLVFVSAAVAATLAACSQGAEPVAIPGPTSAAPSRSAAAPFPSAEPEAPLSGLPVREATAARSAVAVVVDIAQGTPAPVGIGDADLVYVEPIRRGLLRMTSVFQSRLPRVVGPVGEVRPSDGRVLPVWRPVLAYAGGPDKFAHVVDGTAVVDASLARYPQGYERGGRGRPYALVSRLLSHDDRPGPPPVAFQFAQPGERFAPRDSQPARSFTVTLPDGAAMTWRAESSDGTWVTDGGVLPSAAAQNVIVQRTDFKSVNLHWPTGPVEQSARPFGSGTCVAASGGRVAPCSWWKPGPDGLTNFVSTAHTPLHFARGATWILLVPSTARITTAGG
jgi:hypothetical protein